jgi:energy-coupling factor transporter ATP-binding protein EcfA2
VFSSVAQGIYPNEKQNRKKEFNMSTNLEMIKLSDVKTQQVKWLWHPYIPFGKITMLQGDPGEGKTTLVLTITALLSKGIPLPDQEAISEPVSVIYQTAEDGLGDTIKPRLEEAGADCTRVLVIDDSKNPLTFSDERIEQAIIKENAKMFILDPLQAFLGPDVDMHRANEIRPIFRRLANVADRTGCAIVIIGHMNKMSGSKGMYRGLGSIDIAAVARSILLVGRSRDNETRRVMAHIKSSLAPIGQSVTFEIDKGVHFTGKSTITAEQLLNGGGYGTDFKAKKKDCAVEELTKQLANGELPCSEVYDYFNEIGISHRTVDNAKKELGVQSHKRSYGWGWSLT